MNRPLLTLLAASALLALSACELTGGESAEAAAARREAEGKAVGGGCRHAGRAIEDCFALNRRADKAAVFAGWREMNDYMRENKVDTVTPQLAPAPAETAAKADVPATADEPAKGTAKPRKADKTEKSDKADKADKAEKTDKVDKPEKVDKAAARRES